MQKTQLKTAELGATGLEITRIGFGAWAIGGGGREFGWGAQEDEQSIEAIHRALKLGVNWIDTAAYGFGHSEEVVGRAIKGLTVPPFVFTKAWLVPGPGGRVLHNPAVDPAIVGFRRMGQVAPILAAAAIVLTEADVVEIEAGNSE